MAGPREARPLSATNGRAGAIEAELRRRGAERLAHARGSLAEHLTGTAAILAGWEQPDDVRAAGLLHSAYATEAFHAPLFARDERDAVRALIGVRAESLVHAFCSIRREELFAALAAGAEASEPLAVANRCEGGELRLAPRDLADLLVISLANEADQAAAAGGAPDAWLARASRWAAWARERGAVAPPVFDRAHARVSRADERALLDAYAAAFAPGASRLASAARAVPWVAEPAIVVALRALAAREAAAALDGARAARETLRAWGVPWDKRLALEEWLRIAGFIAAAAALRDDAAADLARGLVERGAEPRELLDAVAAFGALDALPPRFARYAAALRRNTRRPALPFYPELTSRPWHDAAELPPARALEAAAPAIAAEFRALDRALFHAESEQIARDGVWDVAMLFERGKRNDAVCARCPATLDVLESHRIVRGPAGLSYFSRLGPHARVAPHRGPTNVRLRCHLGIEIPERCGMTVGGIPGGWEANRCVVFDDSYEHDAWNASDQERIVLIVDLWHPDLDDDEVALLEGMQRYAVALGGNATRYWALNQRAREGAPRTPRSPRAPR